MILRSKMISSLALVLFTVACSSKTSPKLGGAPTQVTEFKYNKGFMLLEGEVQEVSYVADGDVAYISDHTIVPRSEIATSPSELNLTTREGVKQWPGGVIPVRYDPRIPKSELNYMASQFARAGLKVVPYSGQNNYVDLKVTACPKDSNASCTPGYARGGIGFNANQRAHTVEISERILNDQNPTKLTHVLLHEMGHAIGCRHEQLHPEAYKSIRPSKDLIYSNDPLQNKLMLEEMQQELYAAARDSTTVAQTNFDFKSVMLYCDFYTRMIPRNQSEMRRAIQNIEPPPICDPENFPAELSAKDVEGLYKLYEKELPPAKVKVTFQQTRGDAMYKNCLSITLNGGNSFQLGCNHDGNVSKEITLETRPAPGKNTIALTFTTNGNTRNGSVYARAIRTGSKSLSLQYEDMDNGDFDFNDYVASVSFEGNAVFSIENVVGAPILLE